MWDADMQDRQWNERAKLWIFHEIAKWRRWRHASRLTATAVIVYSRYRFLKRWHVSAIKNIAGVDQATLMIHRNSSNIACTFRFYICLCLRDHDCCSVADGNGSCHAPTPLYFEEMTWCRRQKTFGGDDQATLMVHRNSVNIACTFLFYVCLCLCDRD